MAWRDAILNAVLEADRLHREFDTKARAEAGKARIDVFGMLVSRDIPVMFRPLKGLLGAYIDDPNRGVIVTTQRPLPAQRFTAAHELDMPHLATRPASTRRTSSHTREKLLSQMSQRSSQP